MPSWHWSMRHVGISFPIIWDYHRQRLYPGGQLSPSVRGLTSTRIVFQWRSLQIILLWDFNVQLKVKDQANVWETCMLLIKNTVGSEGCWMFPDVTCRHTTIVAKNVRTAESTCIDFMVMDLSARKIVHLANGLHVKRDRSSQGWNRSSRWYAYRSPPKK